MSNILITGGAGFIGRNLVKELSKARNNITILDNFSRTNKNVFFDKGIDVLRIDIRNLRRVKEATKNIDVIFHTAAQIDPYRSIDDPLSDFEVNVRGTMNILCSAVDNGVKRVIFTSTHLVYGDPLYNPIDEKHSTKPKNPYAAGKLASEKFMEAFYQSFGLETVIVRLFNPFGPNQNWGVIDVFFKKIADNKPIMIFGDGNQVRDFIHVSDVVSGLICCMRDRAKGDVYNLGSGVGTTINDLIHILNERIKKGIKVKYVERKKIDTIGYYADITKMKKELCFVPKITLDQGITEKMEEYGIESN